MCASPLILCVLLVSVLSSVTSQQYYGNQSPPAARGTQYRGGTYPAQQKPTAPNAAYQKRLQAYYASRGRPTRTPAAASSGGYRYNTQRSPQPASYNRYPASPAKSAYGQKYSSYYNKQGRYPSPTAYSKPKTGYPSTYPSSRYPASGYKYPSSYSKPGYPSYPSSYNRGGYPSSSYPSRAGYPASSYPASSYGPGYSGSSYSGYGTGSYGTGSYGASGAGYGSSGNAFTGTYNTGGAAGAGTGAAAGAGAAGAAAKATPAPTTTAGNSNYQGGYGPAPQAQQPPQQWGQPQQPPQQWNSAPAQSSMTVNGLAPTEFNPQYKPAPAAQPTPAPYGGQQGYGYSNPSPSYGSSSGYGSSYGSNSGYSSGSSGYGSSGSSYGSNSGYDYSGGSQSSGASSYSYNNPAAPADKKDFSAKGPNPIQLNQFMAMPTAPKQNSNSLVSNSLETLLGALLGGSGIQPKEEVTTTTTTTTTVAPRQVMISERLNDFVLGPQKKYASNRFADIPQSNPNSFDSYNPFAGFMGETLPPPTTTTPAPPGRNGDFLAGFIGINMETPEQISKQSNDANQPNIYMYNYQSAGGQQTTSKPSAQPAGADAALGNLDTQSLSAVVSRLLGVLATKQG